MKRFLIPSASALALMAGASAALANDSTIDQIGALNTVNVDQTGGNEGVSDINQDGTGNLAEVTQSEDPNGVPGFSVPTNMATINQLGGNARARIEQSNPDQPNAPTNTASIDQNSNGMPQNPPDGIPSGFSLNGRIIQDGSGNDSSIVQSGNPNQPPEDGAGSGVTARNEQTGQDNTSTVLQNVFGQDANPFTDANVYQDGVGNASNVQQRGSAALVDVFQIGEGNFSDVSQGANEEMTASVTQNGENHSSEITQIARTVTASVDQSGSGQTSTIEQGGQSRESNATVTQSGMGNTSDVNQTNTSAVATVTQSGTGGMSTFNQSNGQGAMAELVQSGTDNTSTIMQDGDLHTAMVTQSGTMNLSSIMQNDDNQSATVTQTSDDNESYITQSGVGAGNVATVVQAATSGNLSNITQTGTGNMAMVNQ
ncbi:MULTISPECIES: hypothetical protein [unclassified Roseovarius]|uniref:hypothetical protein n=1 Tax=unclassified Roseovarius TaxID=2614913 RepID=UPI00273FF95B|nr:hypothetical protein [Roseovarius sp. MMSF_3350]